MKKTILLAALALMAMAPVTYAQMGDRISVEVINGARQPNPHEADMMRREEAGHPNITGAMHALEKALYDLNRAPDDFGGHKAEAIADTKRAWISLRKALYFRIYRDR